MAKETPPGSLHSAPQIFLKEQNSGGTPVGMTAVRRFLRGHGILALCFCPTAPLRHDLRHDAQRNLFRSFRADFQSRRSAHRLETFFSDAFALECSSQL